MRCLIEQKTLAAEFDFIRALFGRGTMKPVVSLVATEPNVLTIKASDYNMSARADITAAVVEAGEVSTEATKFIELVKAMPRVELTLSKSDHGRLAIEYEGFRSVLPNELVTFPPATEEMPHTAALKGKTLLAMVDKVIGSVPDDTGARQPNALFVVGDGFYRLVATNGAAMAVAVDVEDVSLSGAATMEFLIPKQALVEMTKMLQNTLDKDASIVHGERMFEITVGHRTLRGRKGSGAFPPYASVVPTAYKVSAEGDRLEFLAAVRRTSVMSDAKYQSVILNVTPSEVVIESRDDIDEAQEAVPVVSNGELRTKLKSEFLVNALTAIKSDRFRLQLNAPNQPIVIRPAGTDACGVLYLVAPMAIRNAD